MRLRPPVIAFVLLLASCRSTLSTWPEYGGPLGVEPGGHFFMAHHYSEAAQITKANVARLQQVASFEWTQKVPDAFNGKEYATSVTPIHVIIDGEDFLYGCSAFNQVWKLRGSKSPAGNPLQELATFDPELPAKTDGENYKCRGVSYWLDAEKAPQAACRHKIYSATIDGRLFALDAKTLRACDEFGTAGVVDLKQDLRAEAEPEALEYYVATAPLVYPLEQSAMLVIGGGVRDSYKLDVASGAVRGYDATTGKRLWVWDAAGDGFTQGTPNAWTALAMDPMLGHVYLPTGNASPDYHSASRRAGADDYASSIVALDMRSIDFGAKDARPRVAWHKKLVYRDVWDFDIPAQPILTTIRGIPALVQGTKMGFVFFVDRRTGEWLPGYEPSMVDVTARSHRNGDATAPSIAAPDEQVARAQPFPPAPWRLHPDAASIDDVTASQPST